MRLQAGILTHMKTRIVLLLGAIVFGLSTQISSQDQDKWKRYEPRTLQSIKDSQMKLLKSFDVDLYLSTEEFPSRVKLTYLEKSRPLPPKKKQLLEAWKRMWKEAKFPNDPVEQFQTEVLFQEGSEEYWIAVQKPLLKPLPEEAKPRQMINAYVIWLGAVKVEDHWEWLIAMNEFQALPNPQASP